MLATDLTEEMLEQVRKQVKEKGLGNVDTAHADAEAMPFEDQTFDLVTLPALRRITSRTSRNSSPRLIES